jgi:hypothetical protein
MVLASVTAAFAEDFVVGPNAEYETIQEAVDDASAGDRILIGPGTYFERVFVPDGRRGLQLIGRRAVWDGNQGSDRGDCLSIEADDVVVKGITFRNGWRHVVAQADDLSVLNCTFRGSTGAAIAIDGSGARVESCRFAGTTFGVEISGAEVTIRRNEFRSLMYFAVRVQGDDALVERNSFRTIRHDWCVFVDGSESRVVANDASNVELGMGTNGDNAQLVRNRLRQVRMAAVRAQGYRVVIDANRVQGTGDTAIAVTGDRYEVTGNSVSEAVGDVDGIVVFPWMQSGGGTVEGNVVSDVSGFGFVVYGPDVDVVGNVATNCGSYYGGGFRVDGEGVDVESNQSLACEGTAFVVSGTSNVLRNNLARDAGGDGFQIAGQDIELESNVALRCGGEGLHNAGQGTDVVDCRFQKNRLDVACAHGSGANFAVFRGNVFDTGDEDQEPEVDFP